MSHHDVAASGPAMLKGADGCPEDFHRGIWIFHNRTTPGLEGKTLMLLLLLGYPQMTGSPGKWYLPVKTVPEPFRSSTTSEPSPEARQPSIS
jgi:hypothetical protein